MKGLKKAAEKTVSVFCKVLLIAAIILLCYSFFMRKNGNISFIGKYATVNILTESMHPTIPAGSCIFIEKVSHENLKRGDIITFYSEDPDIYGSLNTHYVREITEEGIVTGGEGRPDDKYLAKKDKIAGRYIRTSGLLSMASKFKSNPVAFFLIIGFPVLIISVMSVRDLADKLKKDFEEEQIRKSILSMKESGELESRIKSRERDKTESENEKNTLGNNG